MAVRGVYTEKEKEFIANFNKFADERVGWAKTYKVPLVTEEDIVQVNYAVDPWNPLWALPRYAASSRWGSCIAHPFYSKYYKPREQLPPVPPGGDFRRFVWVGENIEYFQHIRPGDIIRAWQRRSTMDDVTSLDGNGLRKFNYVDLDADLINQNDEVVLTEYFCSQLIFFPGLPGYPTPQPKYGFTKTELDYLRQLVEGEKIRGAEILYWEDVNVGETITPTVLETTSIMTGLPGPLRPNVTSTERAHMPETIGVNTKKRAMPEYVKPWGQPANGPYIPDSDTGLLYSTSHGYPDDRDAHYSGEPHTHLAANQSRVLMTRLITNWMGDDGFLRKFRWRHLYRTPAGDALIARGKVVKKYVENGEHLVDIKTWTDNMRGNVTEVCYATVNLLSKDDPYPNVKKIVRC